jgi:transposase
MKLMIYAKVNKKGQKKIKKAVVEAQELKWYRRLKIIQLSGQGYGVPELAQMFDLSKATVRIYLKRYNNNGLKGLVPNYRSGRTASLNWTKEQWLDVLNQAPSDFEKLESGAKNWSQALLQQYLAEYHQVHLSQPAISKTLRKVGVNWRRAKLTVTSPDPLYTVKRQRLETLKAKALQGDLTSQEAQHPPPDPPPKRAYLVFFDSTDLHWCPDLGCGYTAQGSQIKVASPGLNNPWYALFGSLIFPSGEGLYTIHEHKRHQEVAAHLQLLIQRDPEGFWFVVMDNASAHTTAQLDPFWQQHQDRLEPVYLPTYSPNLNLIERLWRFMRSQLTRNQFYENLTALSETVVNWLEHLPFSRFCSLMGLDDLVRQFV